MHQDVDLPAGWDRLMLNSYRMAARPFGPIGVAGVYRVGPVAEADPAGSRRGSPGGAGGLSARRIGWVEDRGHVPSEGPSLPAPVATRDEKVGNLTTA